MSWYLSVIDHHACQNIESQRNAIHTVIDCSTLSPIALLSSIVLIYLVQDDNVKLLR